MRTLMLYEFEQSHSSAEAAKSICYVKGEGTIEYCTVSKGGKSG